MQTSIPYPEGVEKRMVIVFVTGAAGLWFGMSPEWGVGFIVGGLGSILNFRIMRFSSRHMMRQAEQGRDTKALTIGWLILRMAVLGLVLVVAGRHPMVELMGSAGAVVLGQMIFFRESLSAARLMAAKESANESVENESDNGSSSPNG